MTPDNPYQPDPVLNADFYSGVTAKRAIAWAIDTAMILFLLILALPFTGFLGIFVWPLLWLVVSFAYRTLTLAGGSSTWGMRIMSIEFRAHDGQAFGFGEAFVHTLIYTVSMGFVVPQVVSVLLMALSQRGQSLGDMLLGSVAINRPVRGR